MQDPIGRFTPTVENYMKYRPSYPHEVLDFLIAECHLQKDKTIADIGSGTGFLSKLFLDYGNTVYGIEPNPAMREAAEDYLRFYPNFYSLNGVAEATHLADHSVDMVAVGTAFHWFDAQQTKIEFKRILRPLGAVVLIWNVRNIAQSQLMGDYENLIVQYGKDYSGSPASQFDTIALDNFFLPGTRKDRFFKNIQYFDWEGFKGRLLSTSYCLAPNDENYQEMMATLKVIFDRYQRNGKIEFLYTTQLYYGLLT